VSANGAQKEREGLSLQTLVIAAAAAGAAAIVTSYFWKNGTILTAAITPVIVALVREALERPMESDIVRRPVQRLAETRTSRRSADYARTGAPSRFEEPPSQAPNGAPPADMGPVRTYGRPPRARRRWHIRAALVTGVLGFAIAAVVLTVPELVFGGSVAGKGRTTIFSTHKSKSRDSGKSTDEKKTSTDKEQTDTSEDAPPAQEPQGTQTSTQPQQETPPAQQAPGGGAPAPQQAPAPAAPPASSPTP
jgi:hypothetical protein